MWLWCNGSSVDQLEQRDHPLRVRVPERHPGQPLAAGDTEQIRHGDQDAGLGEQGAARTNGPPLGGMGGRSLRAVGVPPGFAVCRWANSRTGYLNGLAPHTTPGSFPRRRT